MSTKDDCGKYDLVGLVNVASREVVADLVTKNSLCGHYETSHG